MPLSHQLILHAPGSLGMVSEIIIFFEWTYNKKDVIIEKPLIREEAVSGPQFQANVNNDTGARTLVLMQVSADLNDKNIVCQVKGSFLGHPAVFFPVFDLLWSFITTVWVYCPLSDEKLIHHFPSDFITFFISFHLMKSAIELKLNSFPGKQKSLKFWKFCFSEKKLPKWLWISWSLTQCPRYCILCQADSQTKAWCKISTSWSCWKYS